MKQLLDFALDALPHALNLLYGGFVIHLLGSLGLASYEIENNVAELQEKPLRRVAIIHQAVLLGLATLSTALFLWYRPENFPPVFCGVVVLITLVILWPYAPIHKRLGLYKP